MNDVNIYDSQGNHLNSANKSRDSNISDLSRFGVLFSLHFGTTPLLVTYFRGYETESGRMEQFYAKAELDNITNIQNVYQRIVQVANNQHGIDIEESKTGENIFSSLNGISHDQSSAVPRQERISYLLSQGNQLRFGVRSYEEAISFLIQVGKNHRNLRAAVIEGESNFSGPLSNYDLVVETGPYYEIEPLGETEEMMNPSTESPGIVAELIGADEQTITVALIESLLLAIAVVSLLISTYIIASQFLPFVPSPQLPAGPSLPNLSELPSLPDIPFI